MQLFQMLDRACRLRGAETAFIEPGARVTWREATSRAAKLGGALQGLGVGPGDRVSILALNGHRFVEFYFALARIGAVAVPLNHRLAPGELVALLVDSGSTVLLVDAAFVDLATPLRHQAPALRHVIFTAPGEAPSGLVPYEAALSAAPSAPEAAGGGEDLASIFYTGGTTGRPKGVMHSHANHVAAATSFVAHFDIDDRSIVLSSAPLFHVAATAIVMPAILAAATTVFVPRFTPEAVLDSIAGQRCTIANFVPTMLKLKIEQPGFAERDLSSLRTLVYGAAPMPETLLDLAMKALPRTSFLQAYGQTEVTAIITVLDSRYLPHAGRDPERARSVGRPVMTADLRVLRPDGSEAAPGEIGEIAVRGPMVMKGYWRQPELTAEAMRGGFLHTGDAGTMDAEGFVFLVDRLKDMIISGGENVYSAEVEATLYRHRSVAECAVFGIPHETWGEAVHAVVVPRAGERLSQAELIAHCRTLIAAYKCPRSVEIVAGPLPVSGVSKILKSALRAPFWEGKR